MNNRAKQKQPPTQVKDGANVVSKALPSPDITFKTKKAYRDQLFLEKQLKTESNISNIFGSILLVMWAGYLSKSDKFFSFKPFFKFSYPSTITPNYYTNGFDDLYFVIQLSIHLIFLRASFSRLVGIPLSKLLKVKSPSTQLRFSEQLWGVMLATYAFVLGAYLLYSYPEFLRFNTAWATYPLLQQPAAVKVYYLHQISFWLCTALYLFVEKRRSDFFAMILHHSGTLFLMIGSYCTNFQAMGIIIHFTMDVADIFLPFTKILHYLKLETACNISFVFTAIVWVITRQIGLIRIIYSAAFEAHTYREYEYDPKNGVYAIKSIQYCFVGILVMLEVLCVYWLSSIMRLIVDAISGRALRDVRSEDEE